MVYKKGRMELFLDHVRSRDSMVLIEHLGSAVTVLVNVTCNSLHESVCVCVCVCVCERERERERERELESRLVHAHVCVRERGT